jgi:hypothetical protein
MEPVDAALALLQLVNDYRCAIYAECQPEMTDAAQAPAAPTLPAQPAFQVNATSTSDTGYALKYPHQYGS